MPVAVCFALSALCDVPRRHLVRYSLAVVVVVVLVLLLVLLVVFVDTRELFSSFVPAVVRQVVHVALFVLLWLSFVYFLHELLALLVEVCCFWSLFDVRITFVLSCSVLLALSMLWDYSSPSELVAPPSEVYVLLRRLFQQKCSRVFVTLRCVCDAN